MADSILSMENITKVFTERKVFDHANFYLQEGEKVGVIGVNGTGKSTLLRMIAGLEEPDDGTIIRANSLVVRYLAQTPAFRENDTVLAAAMAGHENAADPWSLESDVKSMLTGLGVTDFTQPVSELSGGQRKRLALVSALAASSDVLVLDEPTNHLDQEMSAWLEDLLIRSRKTIVLVTHDRYFLDRVTNRIIEIDQGHIYSYQTNYSGYLELRMQRQEMALASEAKRQNILRKELAWIRRGARARTTKQKGRIQRYEQLLAVEAPIEEQRVQLDSISTRMGKTTVELENISKAYGTKQLIRDFTYIFLKTDRIGFVGPNGAGKTTLMKIIAGKEPADSGSLTIGQTIKIGYYSQEPEYEDPDSPAFMDPGTKVIDYIKDTAEYVRTNEGLVSASKMLERFLFTSSMQYTMIGKLSGGEKRRLNLLRVLMEAPNVLILDEPTNDLDIATMNILEDYLDVFAGIVIVVSHDRYFLDRTVQRIFAFEGDGRIRQYEGGYSDYVAARQTESGAVDVAGRKNVGVSGKTSGSAGGKNAGASVKMSDGAGIAGGKGTTTSSNEAGANGGRDNRTGGNDSGNGNVADGDAGSGGVSGRSGRRHEQKLKFTWKEQQDFAHIEEEIAALEEKVEALDLEIQKHATEYMKLTELTAEKEAAEEELEQKMDRWMYLEDLAERIRQQESSAQK